MRLIWSEQRKKEKGSNFEYKYNNPTTQPKKGNLENYDFKGGIWTSTPQEEKELAKVDH